MSDVSLAQVVLAQLGTLTIVIAGMTLMLSGPIPVLRRWVGRLMLLGLLFAITASLVTPEWLP